MKRNCEVCGSKKSESVYKQSFLLVGNKKFSYNVVVCRICGFVYASDLPSQKNLNTFYKKNSKYSYHHHLGESPAYMKRFYLNSFKMIDGYLKKSYKNFDKSEIKILDIGCATGYLLSLFKKNRYTNLTGIDPAPECKVAAKELFDLDIQSLVLSEYVSKQQFDIIIFSSVLEHISDLDSNLLRANELLKDGGLLFVSVPDGNNFGKLLNEPFLEFSLEHINYFTKGSLKNALIKYGMKNITYESYPLDIYGGYALNSLWRKDNSKRAIIFDKQGKKVMLDYIDKSKIKQQLMSNKINTLVKKQEKVVVWGVGSFTSRLLATTELQKANIQYFIDSNTDLQGKKIIRLPIKAPNAIRNSKASVLISSVIYGKEIKQNLLKKYNFKGKIILL